MKKEANGGTVPLPIKVGMVLTAAFIVAIAYLAQIRRCTLLESNVLECRSNISWFLDSPPNEIGDTIAGIFATLAFVWIVVTVFLQSSELAEQRKELGLTRQELRLAREAQEKMVEAAQIQASIFADEKRFRDQSHAFSEICALVDEIMRLAKSEAIQIADWRFQKEINGGNTSSRHHSLIVSARDYREIGSVAKISKELSEAIYNSDDKVNNLLSEGWILSLSPELSDPLSKIHRLIERVDGLYESISEADKVRVRSFDLHPLREAIEEVENHPNYWKIWAGREAP